MDKKWKDNDKVLHTGKILINKDGYDVIECELCEFKHIVPLIDIEDQEKFYTEEFYQKETKREGYQEWTDLQIIHAAYSERHTKGTWS